MKTKLCLIIVCLLLASCKGTYHAYKSHNFVPEQESKVRACMGYPYIGHDVNTSMKYYYSLRKKGK